jgi:hypothetical protein
VPGVSALGPLKGPIGFTVRHHAGRKLLWLAHARGAHPCIASAKLLDKGRIHLASERHYSKPLIQSHRGRRSNSSRANHRIFLSRSMAGSLEALPLCALSQWRITPVLRKFGRAEPCSVINILSYDRE